MGKSASVRLMLWKMSCDMASGDIGRTVENIKQVGSFSRSAKQFVDNSIKAVRAAEDADPAWTDEEICEMVIDKIVERVCKCKTQQLPGTLGHTHMCPARQLTP